MTLKNGGYPIIKRHVYLLRHLEKKVPKDQKQFIAPSTYMSFEYNAKYKGSVVWHITISSDYQKNPFKLLKLTTNDITLPIAKVNKVPINPKIVENLRQLEDSIIEEHKTILWRNI